MNIDQSIIKCHEQLYKYSCIPSSVEMVLKLLGKVSVDYYELQREWDNRKDGSFEDFDGRTIEGVTFERKFTMERSKNFPIAELFKTIDDELKDGRLVIISIDSRSVLNQPGYHMWLIYENIENGYSVFSKGFKFPKVLRLQNLRGHVSNMGGTEILVYRKQSKE